MLNFNHLPDSALLRERQLIAPEGPIPFGSASLWRKAKAGTFPPPIRLPDNRMTCWRWGDVRAWLEAQSNTHHASLAEISRPPPKGKAA